MAIFGMSGLWAALLYFGGLAGLYGQTNSGFKDTEDREKWWRIEGRTAMAQAAGRPQDVKRAVADARAQRAQLFTKGPVAGFKEREFLR